MLRIRNYGQQNAKVSLSITDTQPFGKIILSYISILIKSVNGIICKLKMSLVF